MNKEKSILPILDRRRKVRNDGKTWVRVEKPTTLILRCLFR